MSFSQALAKIRENEEIRAKSTPIAMVAPELKQNTEDTEISKTCAVLGCEEPKNLNSDSFFRFPEDPNFRQIWTDLTGRNNWTPTDYSYICVQHFSVDCFECDAQNAVVLNSKAVPSLKLPKHVLEVEYIDEETFDNEYEDDFDNEENQDYEMENEIENEMDDDMEYEEEHLEDHFSDDQIQDQQSSQVHKQYQMKVSHQNEQLQNKQNQIQVTHQIKQQQNTQKQIQLSHQNEQQTKKIQQHSQEKEPIQPKQIEVQNELKQNNSITQPQPQVITRTIKVPVSKNKHLTNGTPKNTIGKSSTSLISSQKVEQSNKIKEQENIELLKLFTELQMMQKQAKSLKMKLKNSMKIHKHQKKRLARLKEEVDLKKSMLVQRRKKKSRILLSLQDKIRADTSGLVLAMPTRHTDDLKNYALSIYKYSPQAYIYIRNTLRTLLPSTDVLDSWLLSGYEATNVLTNSNTVRVVSELTDSELSCKVSIS